MAGVDPARATGANFPEPTTPPLPAGGLACTLFGGDKRLLKVAAGELTLGRGDRGGSLRRVAKALMALGYGLPRHGADGRWHRELRDVLARFQTDHQLEVSGQIDADTVRALDGDLQAGKLLFEHITADGKISADDLVQAEQMLAPNYGTDQARAILVRALGVDPSKMDFDAIDYFNGKVGSLDGHFQRHQAVLMSHIEGAKLLDVNFNGRIDSDDVVFTKGADGVVDTRRVGKALRDRVLVGSAMVEAAYDMAEAQPEFGALKANKAMWHVVPNDPDQEWITEHATLLPGVKASDAIRDIFKNTGAYRFECATAIVVLRYKAMLDLIGEKDFNRICGDMKIGPWQQDAHAEKLWKISGQAKSPWEHDQVSASPAEAARVKPGDYSYFKNWDVSKEGFEAGWQGENVISLGDGLYFGHPFGVVLADEIVTYLNQNRNEGSTRSASLLDLRARIDPKVLDYDEQPG